MILIASICDWLCCSMKSVWSVKDYQLIVYLSRMKPSVLWHCLLDERKGIRTVKSLHPAILSSEGTLLNWLMFLCHTHTDLDFVYPRHFSVAMFQKYIFSVVDIFERNYKKKLILCLVYFREMDEETNISSNTVLNRMSILLLCFLMCD